MAPSKQCLGISALVAGAFLIIAACVSTGVIMTVGKSSLKTTAQYKAPGEKDYNQFVTTTDPDAPSLYFSYYLYNLTNAEQVAKNNVAPVVEELGPYTYQEYCSRREIEFSSDKSEVTFGEFCSRVFRPEMSVTSSGVQLADTDQITSVNYVLYGMLEKLGLGGKETSFKIAAIGQVLGGMATKYAPSLFGSDSTLVGKYWGNCTAYTSALTWTNNGAVDLRTAVQGATGTNNNFVFEFSRFVNSSDPLMLAYKNNVALDNIAFDATQSTTIWFGTNALYKTFTYNLGASNFTGTGSAFIATLAKAGMHSTIASVYGIPASPHAAMLAAWIQYAGLEYFKPAFTAQGSTNYGNETLNHYMWTRSVRNHLFTFAVDPVGGRLGRTDAIGSLFANLDCPTAYAASMNADPTVVDMDACENEWKGRAQAQAKYTVNTGRVNIEDIEEMSRWSGYEVLPQRNVSAGTGFWCSGDFPIHGRRNPNNPTARFDAAEWTMKPRIMDPDYKLVIFNAETLRNVSFGYQQDTEVDGVKTKRFIPKRENFEPNTMFSVSQYGVFDLTCPKGVSLELTQSHYYDSQYLSGSGVAELVMAEGVPAAQPVVDEIWLDVEPMTGKTIQAQFKLQVNLFAKRGRTGLTGASNDTLFPILYVNKHSKLSNANAKDLRAAQTALMKAPVPVLIAGCVVGGVLVLLGIVLLILHSKAPSVAQSTSVQSSFSDVGYAEASRGSSYGEQTGTNPDTPYSA